MKMSERTAINSCLTYIPVRYVFVGLTSCAFFITYCYKAFLSVAIVAMVSQSNTTETTGNECPFSEGLTQQINNRGVDGLDWSASQQALVLSAYFYGYIITQIPAGLLAKRLSAKWIIGFSLFISAILSFLGPIAAHWHFVAYLCTRVGQGLVLGTILPCMNTLVAKWMPKLERTRAIGFILVGADMGCFVSILLTGYLCDLPFLGGWPSIFYLLGIVSCVWFIFWSFFVYDSPKSHPFITQSEYDFIIEGQGDDNDISSLERKTPWKSIFTSYQVYTLFITHFGQNWGYLTILTLLPTYYTNILHMSLTINGIMSCLPYIALSVMSCIASYITDKLRERGISITVLRKVNTSIAFIGPGICLIAVVLSKCDTTLNVIFFTLGMAFNGFNYSGYLTNFVDIAPQFVGIIMGFANAFGNIPGFCAPTVASDYYSKGQSLQNWSYVWYTCSGIYFITLIVYILFGSSERQPWAQPKEGE